MTPHQRLGSWADQICEAQPPPKQHPPAQLSDRGHQGGPAGSTRQDNSLGSHRQAWTLRTEERRDCPPPPQQAQAHSGPLHWENSGLGCWNTPPAALHPKLSTRGPVRSPGWRPAPCSAHLASDATSALGSGRPRAVPHVGWPTPWRQRAEKPGAAAPGCRRRVFTMARWQNLLALSVKAFLGRGATPTRAGCRK